MSNERLRAALLSAGLTPTRLADELGVNVKTVERWIGGRPPYRKWRYATAARLGVEESYLWPSALTREQIVAASESEIITIYPHRWAVPREVWINHFAAAKEEVSILTMAGIFLVEDSGIIRLLREKAEARVRVRLLIGDPDCEAVRLRGVEEGIGDVVASRVRNVLALLRPLNGVVGVETRLHRTCLYTSIFRADDQMLVNTHVYGMAGANAPAMHLRKVAGGDMVTTYQESYEKVWATATPLEGKS